MKKIVTIVFIILPFLLNAQKKELKGRVIDANTQQPLSGATVKATDKTISIIPTPWFFFFAL